MENLFDLCCNYIENSHSLDGQMIANEKIYNYCVEYINTGCTTPQHIVNTLRKQFSKYLN